MSRGTLRLVKFTRDLLQPFRVSAGDIVPLERSVLEGLQASQEGRGATFDLTPGVGMLAVLEAYGGHPVAPEAALYAVACPECGSRPSAAFVVCPECHNARRVWTPNVIPRETWESERRRFWSAMLSEAQQHYAKKGGAA